MWPMCSILPTPLACNLPCTDLRLQGTRCDETALISLPFLPAPEPLAPLPWTPSAPGRPLSGGSEPVCVERELQGVLGDFAHPGCRLCPRGSR